MKKNNSPSTLNPESMLLIGGLLFFVAKAVFSAPNNAKKAIDPKQYQMKEKKLESLPLKESPANWQDHHSSFSKQGPFEKSRRDPAQIESLRAKEGIQSIKETHDPYHMKW